MKDKKVLHIGNQIKEFLKTEGCPVKNWKSRSYKGDSRYPKYEAQIYRCNDALLNYPEVMRTLGGFLISRNYRRLPYSETTFIDVVNEDHIYKVSFLSVPVEKIYYRRLFFYSIKAF